MKLHTLVFILLVLIGCTPNDHSESTLSPELLVNVEKPSYAHGFQFITINGKRYLQLFDLANDSTAVTYTVSVGDSSHQPYIDGKHIYLNHHPRIATLSTTHLAYFLKAGSLHSVVGTAYAEWVQNEIIQAEIAKGNMKDISGEKDIDFEKTIALSPDVLLTYPYGDSNYSNLKENGIDILPLSEYLEKHPLGRAEWIKVIGFLAGNETETQALFDRIVAHYHELTRLVHQHEKAEKPIVFTGSHSNGKWYAPPKSSFIAQFIEDAGGAYLFNDPSWEESSRAGENIEMDFEVFISKAAQADFWGKVVYEDVPLSYISIAQEDPRYASLKAFSNQGIFYCNASKTDYFGNALLEPHFILEDLMQLIHPEFFDSDKAYIPHYFQPL